MIRGRTAAATTVDVAPAVLVVDDDATLANVMATALGASGYDVSIALSGTSALAATETSVPDLVVLDLGLGDLDGVDVCRRLRERSTVPIIVVSGEDAEHRKIEALDAGANDYVTKPFSVPELLARMRAALRAHQSGMAVPGEVLHVGDLVIDVDAYTTTADSAVLDLTSTEFALLVGLARGPGKVLTHDAISRLLWPGAAAGSHGALRVHMTNLRRKLGEGPRRPVITTVPKLGYRLLVPGTEG